jgi:hypothetical protein
MTDHHAADIDLTPVLTGIAALAKRIYTTVHPSELTADEAMSLLTILMQITARLDAEQHPRPALRLVRDDDGPTTT